MMNLNQLTQSVQKVNTAQVQKTAQGTLVTAQKQAQTHGTALLQSAQTKAAVELLKQNAPLIIAGGAIIAGLFMLPAILEFEVGNTIRKTATKAATKAVTDAAKAEIKEKAKEPKADIVKKAQEARHEEETQTTEEDETKKETLKEHSPKEEEVKEEIKSESAEIQIDPEQLVEEKVMTEQRIAPPKEELVLEPVINEVPAQIEIPVVQPTDTTPSKNLDVQETIDTPTPEEIIPPEIPPASIETPQEEIVHLQQMEEPIAVSEPLAEVLQQYDPIQEVKEPTDEWIKLRIKDPKLFIKGSWITKQVNPNVKILLAIKKGTNKLQLQAMRFKDKVTLKESKKDIEQHYKGKIKQKESGHFALFKETIASIKTHKKPKETKKVSIKEINDLIRSEEPQKQDKSEKRRNNLKKRNDHVSQGAVVKCKSANFKGLGEVIKVNEFTFTVKDEEEQEHNILKNMVEEIT